MTEPSGKLGTHAPCGPAPYYEDDWSTIYHGDMFDVLPHLSGIGAVITDPPYSSGGAFRGDRAQQTSTKYVTSGTLAYRPDFAGDNRDQRSFLAWCALWLNAARSASTPGSPVACFIDWRKPSADERTHIAQKPEPVMRWVTRLARPGSVVLDPFMGSGTTLRAAKDIGCKSVGIEVDERYCEIAATRLAQEVLDFGGVA